MNKTLKTISVIIVAVAFLMSIAIVPANACTVTNKPAYNLGGVWNFNDAGYPHVMAISCSFSSNGAFSGVGYYLDGAISWTITGTEVGNVINFVLIVNSPPYPIPVTLTGTGTMTSSTSMSGTGYQTNYGFLSWSATKATEVINVSWLVINEEDARWGAGYWAMDSFLSTLQVWQLSDGSYYAQKTYDGLSVVPQGAISPFAGTLEPKAGVCTFVASYSALVTGTLAPTTFADGSALKTNGYLGVNNQGGTFSDILLGTAGLGSPHDWYWFTYYFAPTSTITFITDTWTYHLICPTTANNNLVETGVYSTYFPYSPVAVGDIIT